ncbi:MAG: SpoIIE family protein phosphatase, partial [Planctomycetes bacterium]|nr:SpoIIE family protein phosphatase [Planctomycetota bacterium]
MWFRPPQTEFRRFAVRLIPISPCCRQRIESPSGPRPAYPSTIARTREVELLPGDFLLLTTEGFFEWANPQGEIFGKARLIESALRVKSRTSAEIIK